MRTCIKAWTSLNLGQIPPLTMELAALERLKNRRHHLVFIRSFSNLQVMRTGIISWMSSNFGQIWLQTTELAALERRKKIPIDLNWEKPSHYVFLAVFDRIPFILAGNEDIHKSLYEFEFRTDPATDYGVSCPWASKKSMSSRNLCWYWSNLFQTCW